MPPHRRVRTFVATIAVTTLAASGCAPLLGARSFTATSPDGTTFHTIAVGDARRGFLLHRPPHPADRLPVLFVLHGTSANANVVMDESGMNALGDSIGALVVYPNGTSGIPYIRLFWNTEHCCDSQTPRGADEVGMMRAIMDTLALHFTLDRSRIGLIGFSDAGTLAYRIACGERGARGAGLSAIGVISGEVPDSTCVPAAGISTIVFHGTADRNIRYGHTAENVAMWAQRDGCERSARDSVAGALVTEFTRCAQGAAVTLYTIVDGKHAWPGGRRSNWLAPRPSRAVDASRLFADFVLAHPRTERR